MEGENEGDGVWQIAGEKLETDICGYLRTIFPQKVVLGYELSVVIYDKPQ